MAALGPKRRSLVRVSIHNKSPRIDEWVLSESANGEITMLYVFGYFPLIGVARI